MEREGAGEGVRCERARRDDEEEAEEGVEDGVSALAEWLPTTTEESG